MFMSTRHSLAGASPHHKPVKAGLTGAPRLPSATVGAPEIQGRVTVSPCFVPEMTIAARKLQHISVKTFRLGPCHYEWQTTGRANNR
jgi:hypothetical protein